MGPPPQDPATDYSEECRPADRFPLLSLEVVQRSDRVEQQRHQNAIRKPKRGVEQPRLYNWSANGVFIQEHTGLLEALETGLPSPRETRPASTDQLASDGSGGRIRPCPEGGGSPFGQRGRVGVSCNLSRLPDGALPWHTLWHGGVRVILFERRLDQEVLAQIIHGHEA